MNKKMELQTDTKIWFEEYAKKIAGKQPCYICFRTIANLHVGHVQLVSNTLLQPDVAIDPRVIFLEVRILSVYAKCSPSVCP